MPDETSNKSGIDLLREAILHAHGRAHLDAVFSGMPGPGKSPTNHDVGDAFATRATAQTAEERREADARQVLTPQQYVDLINKLQTAAQAADVNPLAYLSGLIDKAGSQPPERVYDLTFYVDASVSAGKFVDMEAIGKQMLNAAMIVRATDGKEWPYGRVIGFSVGPVKPQ